ncbi:MAG: helix-turn-helix domain-containing protein, partial [Actinobacteria bacterium]|nr:helix-turn-helix domain-containing protein [Actinomycetota bacterium]
MRDLREVRARTGLGHGELAARAHYPRDVITAAEAGPGLPELPVLAAYVRGCGGTSDDVAGWEDRWRSVTGAAASTLLPARASGFSDAASAGARSAGTRPPAASAATEGEAAVVIAALNRFAERMAQPTSPADASASAEPTPAADSPPSPAERSPDARPSLATGSPPP